MNYDLIFGLIQMVAIIGIIYELWQGNKIDKEYREELRKSKELYDRYCGRSKRS
jgi:hypothetical protein